MIQRGEKGNMERPTTGLWALCLCGGMALGCMGALPSAGRGADSGMPATGGQVTGGGGCLRTRLAASSRTLQSTLPHHGHPVADGDEDEEDGGEKGGGGSHDIVVSPV
jgi:hypothetical protein